MFRPVLFSPSAHRGLLLAPALFLVWVAPLHLASAAKGAQKDEKAHVYTDEDLKNLHRPPAPADGSSGAIPLPQTQPQSWPQTLPAPQTRPAAQTQTQVSSSTSGSNLAAPPENGEWAQEWKRAEDRQQYWLSRIRAAEDRVSQLEQLLEYLSRKRASIENPYLARPTLSPEDQQAEGGMDGAARLARVQAQTTQARQDLEEARRAVERARAEAAEALAPPDATGWTKTNN